MPHIARNISRSFLLLAAFFAWYARTAEAATNCGTPQANQAIVWQNPNFSGNCQVLSVGSYSTATVTAWSVGNNNISSVSVGSSVKITLYDGELPPVQSAFVSSVTSRSLVSDFDNRASSVVVTSRTSCPAPGPYQAVVWNGNLTGNCDLLDIGNYSTQAIKNLSVGNDTISSVSLGSKVHVRLYADDLFSADNTTVMATGAVPTFNDKTSSFQVGLGRWSKVSTPFPAAAGPYTLQLLMDGTVLGNDATLSPDGQRAPFAYKWYRYTPSSSPSPSGGYASGTWSAVGDSRNGRTAFASGMLKDGRYFTGGGEYEWDRDGLPYYYDTTFHGAPSHFDPTMAYADYCEVFDPRTNQWSDVPPFPSTHLISDGIAAPLPDGRLVVGPAYVIGPDGKGANNNQTMLFDPYTDPAHPWSTLATFDGKPTYVAEGSFCLLQNGNVFAAENGAAEYLVQGSQTGDPTNTWAGILQMPANNPSPNEGGSALTLYNGQVLVMGGSGFNAIYTPSTNGRANPRTNAFQNTTTTPLMSSGDEDGQAVMRTGNVLMAAHGPDGTHFFEYWPSTAKMYDVTLGGPQFGGVLQTPLPDGSVLVASPSSHDLYRYEPSAPTLTSFGQPVIDSISGPTNGVYTMTGRTLNGLTNGANIDDEGQNYTSFPLISLSYLDPNNVTAVKYASVASLSTMSITPGISNTVAFRLPPVLPPYRTLTLQVSASGLPSVNTTGIMYAPPVIPLVGDFDGDSQFDDLGLWTPGDGSWWAKRKDSTAVVSGQVWGVQGDIPLIGDFDSDGQLDDLGIWRPSDGTWHAVRTDRSVLFSGTVWGVQGDVPLVGDFDSDGKRDDLAVWRPSNGHWFAIRTDGSIIFQDVNWGVQGDIPLVGDFDGDGQFDDLAVWRPSNGHWFAIRTDGSIIFQDVNWGVHGDIPLVGDFDSDGQLDDLGVWRPFDGTWHAIRRDGSVLFSGSVWGVQGDIPLVGDFDSDGMRDDLGVFRPSDGTWHAKRTDNSVIYSGL